MNTNFNIFILVLCSNFLFFSVFVSLDCLMSGHENAFKSVIVKKISSSTRNQYKDQLPGGAVVYSIVMAG